MFLLLGCLTTPSDYDGLLARAQDADGDGFAALEYGGRTATMPMRPCLPMQKTSAMGKTTTAMDS